MTAKEMFRAKDFVPFFETPALFVYESFSERDIDRIDIAFYKYDKKFLVYYVDRDDPVEIDMPLLKAINQQCKELGVDVEIMETILIIILLYFFLIALVLINIGGDGK